MSNVVFTIRFCGSAFHGWQVQKNAYTVQQAMQDALERAVGFRPDLSGCSRTDSGVHANEYVCHVSGEGISLTEHTLPRALNAYIAKDPKCAGKLAVVAARRAEDGFHSRYSCTGKEYLYKIWNKPYLDPFLEGRALFYPRKIDLDKLAFVGEEFCGTRDFAAFMSKGAKNERDTVRTLRYFRVTQREGLIEIALCADGFLYNMARIIVGTWLLAAEQGLQKAEIARMIRSCDRSLAGDTAPAHGLYLNRVFY